MFSAESQISSEFLKKIYEELKYYFSNDDEDVSIFKYNSYAKDLISNYSNRIFDSLTIDQKSEYQSLIGKKSKSKESFNLDKTIDVDLKKAIRFLANDSLNKRKKPNNRIKFFHPLIQKTIIESDLKKIAESDILYKHYNFLNSSFIGFYFDNLIDSYLKFRPRISTTFLDKSKWYEDEFLFIISIINEQIIEFINKRLIDESHNNGYPKEYIRRMKNIIAVDEASDLGLIDLKCIYSFRHFDQDVSSVTLCGDIMQRMKTDGIRNWDNLNDIIEGFKRYELKTSFRQSPTLLDLARRIFKEVTGTSARYKPRLNRHKGEPQPLLFIDKLEQRRLMWIVDRVSNVFKAYGNQMPATAIFVPSKDLIDYVSKKLNQHNNLDKVVYVPYSSEIDLSKTKNQVLVFSVDQIKGLEFEVVFFHDLGCLPELIPDSDIILRYIYVGISRAAYYFAMTSPIEFDGKLKFLNKALKQDTHWN